MAHLLPTLTVYPSQGPGDCAVIALAVYLGISYPDAIEAASSVSKKPHRKGMYLYGIQAAAEQLGMPLIKRRRFDLEQDHGILAVKCAANREATEHVVVLRWGLLFDATDVWEPEAFMEHYKAIATSLLTRKEED